VQNYKQCNEISTELKEEFPRADEVLRLLELRGRLCGAKQAADTGKSKKYFGGRAGTKECTALLLDLQKGIPGDRELESC